MAAHNYLKPNQNAANSDSAVCIMPIPPPPTSRKRLSTNHFFLDFLYVIKMLMDIHLVYIVLLLKFVLGASLFFLDYGRQKCRPFPTHSTPLSPK